MTMVASYDADEALIAAARQAFGQNKQRSERVCFYRTPQRKTDGAPHKQAGWIGWGDTQESIKWGKIARGYLPLDRFGFIQTKRLDSDPDGAFETYGPWGVILSQPGGMAEFPREQILAYHWYDAERLRMSLNGQLPPNIRTSGGMVQWPQLAGEDLRVFACPECSDWRTLEAADLARHLRIWHDYDRADIIAFGAQYGVDFVTEVNRGGRVIRSYSFEDTAAEPEPEPAAAGFTLEVARPTRRGSRQEG